MLQGGLTDLLCNPRYREVGRRRAACIAAGACDPAALDFVRFDRLLALIPEHTWGLDTTFYLDVSQPGTLAKPFDADYDDWSNAQLQAALSQQRKNYMFTIESWQEQRSYIANAIRNLDSKGPHAALREELTGALEALAPRQLAAARAEKLRTGGGFVAVPSAGTMHCAKHGASIRFASDGSIGSLSFDGRTIVSDESGGGRLGQTRYQTLSEDSFTRFDKLYTGNCLGSNATDLENIGCHNFAKPNMSSAYGGDRSAGDGVFSPTLSRLWRDAESCSFVTEAAFEPSLYTLRKPRAVDRLRF